MEVPGCMTPAPSALDWAHPRSHDPHARIPDRGPRPGQARETVLVVANTQQGTKQDGRRNPDQPHSKENQPEGHALPVVAYAELNSMLHQLQDAALVSSRTVRRNPARLRRKSALSAGLDSHPEAVSSWTEPASFRPGTGQPAASGLLLYVEHLGLPARAPGSSGCSSTHTLERRSSFYEAPFPPAVRNSDGCLTQSVHRTSPPPCPDDTPLSPVQTSSPRPQPLATSPSALNSFEPMADVLIYGPFRSFA